MKTVEVVIPRKEALEEILAKPVDFADEDDQAACEVRVVIHRALWS